MLVAVAMHQFRDLLTIDFMTFLLDTPRQWKKNSAEQRTRKFEELVSKVMHRFYTPGGAARASSRRGRRDSTRGGEPELAKDEPFRLLQTDCWPFLTGAEAEQWAEMVFESVLVDILNRYLRPYVKRLDPSQIKVGVWKGELASGLRLQNVQLTQTPASVCPPLPLHRVLLP